MQYQKKKTKRQIKKDRLKHKCGESFFKMQARVRVHLVVVVVMVVVLAVVFILRYDCCF